MMAYYGQPIEYFTDVISENQFNILFECMAEAVTKGSENEYEIGEDDPEPDLEQYKQIYGNERTVSR